MGKLLNDEQFRHVSYHSTDVRKTWARERKRVADLKLAADNAAEAERDAKVRKIKAAT